MSREEVIALLKDAHDNDLTRIHSNYEKEADGIICNARWDCAEKIRKAVALLQAKEAEPELKECECDGPEKCLLHDRIKQFKEIDRLTAELKAKDEMLAEIQDVASGEKQVAWDDTEGMSWIYKRIASLKERP